MPTPPPVTLTALVALPLAGGLVAAVAGRRSPSAARWVALLTSVALLALAVWLWVALPTGSTPGSSVALEQRVEWIPEYGVSYHLALDGLSLPFIVLTALLGTVAVLASWREIRRAVAAHYLCLLATLSGIFGVFLAWDLLLFYFFWELMLVPMYLLIGVWGHERRIHAAVKFVLYTLISGLFLLIAILGLYTVHGVATGTFTMSYAALLGSTVPAGAARWILVGFLLAFAVKLPLFPLHSWLPDAHGEAPTAGSILLAGLLLKTGGYGLIRFAFPLFPDAARSLAPLLAGLGVVGILYGAIVALGQSDLKRMIAYSSVSHMGFVMLGVAAWRLDSLQGAVVQMLAHGIATGALFAVAGMVKERVGSRDFADLGGLWPRLPRLGALALLFVLASLGLPGLGNFVGEFLVLLGSFGVFPLSVTLAVIGIVVGTVTALSMMQRTFYEPREDRGPLVDLTLREAVMLGALAIAIVALGVRPQPVLDVAGTSIRNVLATGAPFEPADPEISTPEGPDRTVAGIPLPGAHR